MVTTVLWVKLAEDYHKRKNFLGVENVSFFFVVVNNEN